MPLYAVLTSDRGLVVAPAGCGKTHLITETLNVEADKPYLVLTHTTAGVAALKKRLKRLGVPSKNYVVSTIDGWALRIAKMFPASCNILTAPENSNVFYPELRRKVNGYISAGNLSTIIKSSYSRLLVDEYQDCNVQQHTLICSLAESLPTIVFGDPMQCIFNFKGQIMPSWDSDVITNFPIIAVLDTPWRWVNAGAPELGQWILNCRDLLLSGQSIDLLSCPTHVHWRQLSTNAQTNISLQIHTQYQIRTINNVNDSLLVIGDSINSSSRHNFASSSRGVDVVEPVDLKDVTAIAGHMDNLSGFELADKILLSVASMMTGVGYANIKKRMPTILSGRNRTPATDIELAVKLVIESNNKNTISNLLNILEYSPNTHVAKNGDIRTPMTF